MKLSQLADALGLKLHGDPNHEVTTLSPVETAGEHDLAFVVSKRYTETLKGSKAGVVILPEVMLADAPGHALVSDNAYASYARASWLLYPATRYATGVHPTALVHAEASVSDSASIGPYVVIGAGSRIADEVVIDAHCTIGENVDIGRQSRLFARVAVGNKVSIGQHCRIQSGAIIGSEGFGYAWQGESWLQIQQIGGVQIGDRVHIGANTTIDCGAITPTIIEEGVILDNLIQVAHNVRIGKHTAIAACTGIAGSASIGRHCQIGGSCNIMGHARITDGVVVSATTFVTGSITEKGRYGAAIPFQPERLWRRTYARLRRLDELFKRVGQLERELVKTTKPGDKSDA